MGLVKTPMGLNKGVPWDLSHSPTVFQGLPWDSPMSHGTMWVSGKFCSHVYFKNEVVEATLPRPAVSSPLPPVASPTRLAALAEVADHASPMVVEPAPVPPVRCSSYSWVWYSEVLSFRLLFLRWLPFLFDVL